MSPPLLQLRMVTIRHCHQQLNTTLLLNLCRLHSHYPLDSGMVLHDFCPENLSGLLCCLGHVRWYVAFKIAVCFL